MNLNSMAHQNSPLNSLALHWSPSIHLMNDQFFDFCQVNKELRIELTA
jgi:hypothetical protein